MRLGAASCHVSKEVAGDEVVRVVAVARAAQLEGVHSLSQPQGIQHREVCPHVVVKVDLAGKRVREWVLGRYGHVPAENGPWVLAKGLQVDRSNLRQEPYERRILCVFRSNRGVKKRHEDVVDLILERLT